MPEEATGKKARGISGTPRGRVTDAAMNAPLGGVRVRAFAGEDAIAETDTSAAGLYDLWFPNLKAKTVAITLRFTANKYEPAERDIVLDPEGAKEQDVALEGSEGTRLGALSFSGVTDVLLTLAITALAIHLWYDVIKDESTDVPSTPRIILVTLTWFVWIGSLLVRVAWRRYGAKRSGHQQLVFEFEEGTSPKGGGMTRGVTSGIRNEGDH